MDILRIIGFEDKGIIEELNEEELVVDLLVRLDPARTTAAYFYCRCLCSHTGHRRYVN